MGIELDVATLTEAIAAAHPDRPALVSTRGTATWAQTAQRSRRLAAVFAEHGIRRRSDAVPGRSTSPHDHVALYLHNGPEYLEGMLGAWKAGCASFNVNYRYVADELVYLLDDAGARAVVVHDCFAPVLADVLARLRRRPELILQVRDGSPHTLLGSALEYEAALASVSADLSDELVGSWSGDDLYLCYTGGTTGMPKGTMWRQGDFLVAALGVRRRDGSEYTEVDEVVADAARCGLRALPAPPLMHGAAHWNALSCWLSGGTVIIQDGVEHFDPADVLDAAERHSATSLLVVGDPMARPLIDTLSAERAAGRTRDLGALRHLLSGGAVLSPGSKSALIDLVPGLSVVDVLGSTESGRQGVSRVADGDDPSTRFAPSATTVVLDETRTRRLAPGEDELGWLAQGGRVPLGYLGDPEKTAATFPDLGGVRYAVAGDRATLDAEGRVVLRGRDSVCINTGGEKVFVEEVETALKTHPAVFDAVVCGRPSERFGEEVAAVVSLRPGMAASDAELRAAAGQHLARYKLPRVVVRRAQVVRAPSGKADYRWAVDQVAEATGPSHASGTTGS